MAIDWKKFEQNNKTISQNISSVPHNAKAIWLAYKSKYNHKHESKVVLLMITNGKRWHYLGLKSKLVFDGKKWHNYITQCLQKLL